MPKVVGRRICSRNAEVAEDGHQVLGGQANIGSRRERARADTDAHFYLADVAAVLRSAELRRLVARSDFEVVFTREFLDGLQPVDLLRQILRCEQLRFLC